MGWVVHDLVSVENLGLVLVLLLLLHYLWLIRHMLLILIQLAKLLGLLNASLGFRIGGGHCLSHHRWEEGRRNWLKGLRTHVHHLLQRLLRQSLLLL